MATQRALTDFENILLGLIVLEPRSGYDLKQFFARSPAGVYAPSSGTLYPALKRLEERGLLRSDVQAEAGSRGRRTYMPTGAGLRHHRRWLRRPVDGATVGRDLGIHLMRFVMAERVLSAAEISTFLAGLDAALSRFITDMEAVLARAALTGRHAALAVEHGLAIHRASLDWVRTTAIALRPPVPPRAGGGRGAGRAGS